MKPLKHLLFLSILCSLVLFTNCGEDSEDPVADTPTNTTDDDSNTVLDADGDGVADADDTCADTPSGETVDSSGCSGSQKDTDGDGVTDDFDTCADTPEGAEVDDDGCSDSQKDTDGDGVTDDLDTCADTAEDNTVDENGCADYQRDTDGDGVIDDIDTCADTAEGATVDTNGCAETQYIEIGGIYSSNTILDSETPYKITTDVQIAHNTTFEISSGVKIMSGKIIVFGELKVLGTSNSQVNFENVNIVGGATLEEPFKIDIINSSFSDGSLLSPTGNGMYGSLSLKNSTINNLDYMYLWYPVENCIIEKNIFINSGKISVGTKDSIKVEILNNLFISDNEEVTVENWASYNSSKTIVSFNSFINNADKIILKLPGGGYDGAYLNGENNYWNTTDKTRIESMIYDKNDDLSCADIIPFEPFLSEPDPNTPIYNGGSN
jgi:hypothetical protein